jgi:hypothetical protein
MPDHPVRGDAAAVAHSTQPRYAISFRGRPTGRVHAAFGDDAIETAPGITTVSCANEGAHGVHRVLATLGDLGLELLEVRSVGPVPGPDDGRTGGFRVSIQGALTVDHIAGLDDPSEVRATDDVVTLVARDSAELSRLVQVVRDNGLALIGVEKRDATRDG